MSDSDSPEGEIPKTSSEGFTGMFERWNQKPKVKELSDKETTPTENEDTENKREKLLKEAAIKLSRRAKAIFQNPQAMELYDMNDLDFTIGDIDDHNFFDLTRAKDIANNNEDDRQELELAKISQSSYSVQGMDIEGSKQKTRSFYFGPDGFFKIISYYSDPNSARPEEILLHKDKAGLYVFVSDGDETDFEFAASHINGLVEELGKIGIKIEENDSTLA